MGLFLIGLQEKYTPVALSFRALFLPHVQVISPSHSENNKGLRYDWITNCLGCCGSRFCCGDLWSRLHRRSQAASREGDGISRIGGHGQRGAAFWYDPGFHGRRTASGETFNTNALTAAHKTLPFGSRVRVTTERTGRSVVVRINDRGPYAHGRVIDLSKAAAQAVGVSGVGRVTLTRL